jgi:ATP-dependent helicase/DNAse subunit B
MYVPELPLSYSIGNMHITGSIDMYVMENNHVMIYDYKTGANGKTSKDVIEKYGYQALLYAIGALSDDSAESVQVSFVMVESGMEEVRTPVWKTEDLDRMLAALRN